MQEYILLSYSSHWNERSQSWVYPGESKAVYRISQHFSKQGWPGIQSREVGMHVGTLPMYHLQHNLIIIIIIIIIISRHSTGTCQQPVPGPNIFPQTLQTNVV